jgi:hypothetical protein
VRVAAGSVRDALLIEGGVSMPHKVVTGSDLETIASGMAGVKWKRVGEGWTAALNKLERDEGWRVVTSTQGALTKEPIIILFKEV